MVKMFDDREYYSISEAWLSEETEATCIVLEHFFRKKKVQPWLLVKTPRLAKIFRDYMSLGFVRDEKGINEIADKFVTITAKLTVNTILCGHTPNDPMEYLQDGSFGEDVVIDEKEFSEWGDNYFFDEKSGSWRISDYGLQPLQELCLELMRKGMTAESKLQTINKMLMIVHQRSDLSSWFVKGGRCALDEITGYSEDDIKDRRKEEEEQAKQEVEHGY